MAAIVRVKRRISEDPADSLLLSCKRLKSAARDVPSTSTSVQDVKGVFKFAGTVDEKNAVVTGHVRDAIRKEKLEREYKQHQTDVSSRNRRTKKAATKLGRFKVVSSRRASDLFSLDQEKEISEQFSTKSSASDVESQTNFNLKDSEKISESKTDTGNSSYKDGSISEENKRALDENQSGKSESTEEDKVSRVFCLYDVEQDHIEADSQDKVLVQQPQETLTCNGVAMIREKVQTKPVVKSESSGYVYDIYYLNKPDFDFHALENILAIEAFKDEVVYDRTGSDNGEMCDDDDDSNDEGNWRNDYPEDDPDNHDGFLGGDDYNEDYDVEYSVAELMGQRLKICDEEDELSSDGEDFVYFNQPLDGASMLETNRSYDSYKTQMIKELKQDYGEDDDDIHDIDELS